MRQIFIAHRGNFNGPVPARENDPDYIREALAMGYDVEIDVRLMHDGFYLGHDFPEYYVDLGFLTQTRGLWIHCKNEEALEELSTYDNVNAFMHTDGVITTKNGYLWTAPGGKITSKSIAVMPELDQDWDIDGARGICSDYMDFYKTL